VKLRRCPSCRGYTEELDHPRCFACGAELPREAADVHVKFKPRALASGKKDKKVSNGLLVTFGVFGGLGALSIVTRPDIPALPRIALGLLLLVAAVLGVLSMAGVKNPTAAAIGRPMLKLFAFFGVIIVGGFMLVVGLCILLFLVCAIGGTPSFR